MIQTNGKNSVQVVLTDPLFSIHKNRIPWNLAIKTTQMTCPKWS